MPFGGGAHKCIGMHFAAMVAKCFMHQFLQNYEYATPKDYNPKMDFMPLPKPHDGIPLTLKAIK
jgi:cytochrome P450